MKMNDITKREELKQKAITLYKCLKKEKGKELSKSKINEYIDDLDDLKDNVPSDFCSLRGLGEIEKLGGFFSSKPTEEDIRKTFENCMGQLKTILRRMGVDLDEIENPRTSHQPPSTSATSINIAPIMTQNQKQETHIHTQIQTLFKELEKELEKPEPNKSSLVEIIKKIKSVLSLIGIGL